MLILKNFETEVKFNQKVTNKVIINKVESRSNFSIFKTWYVFRPHNNIWNSKSKRNIIQPFNTVYILLYNILLTQLNW